MMPSRPDQGENSTQPIIDQLKLQTGQQDIYLLQIQHRQKYIYIKKRGKGKIKPKTTFKIIKLTAKFSKIWGS